MNNNIIMTTSQAANVLKINENTLVNLAVCGKIPHIRIKAAGEPQFRFNSLDIINWLKHGPALILQNKDSIKYFEHQVQKKFPEALAEIQEFNKQFIIPRKGKGYNLTKVKNKKMGFVYHVRYIENGHVIPTWRSTHTNNEKLANEFAINNRDKVISEYHQRKFYNKINEKIYPIFHQYYKKDSIYLKKDMLRGRILCEKTRSIYNNSIIHHWIPFLKKYHIKNFEEINTPLMTKYQDYCLAKGHKPQTVNHYVCYVSNIFDYLLIRGQIKNNPCTGLVTIKVKETDNKIRNCYNINELKGIFNKRWPDELSYLLCLVIYTTGMRNSEMDRIQIKDIIKIGQYRFIHIPKSKTKFGERYVPLHDFVYIKIKRYIDKRRKNPDDLLFCQKNGKPISRHYYSYANIVMGMFTRQEKNRILDYELIKKKLNEENITFYSGRHFWKTLMNAYDLGEIEEYFMGHKVSNDVAKRYNHRDKQGQHKIIQKAREVFKILDRSILLR